VWGWLPGPYRGHGDTVNSPQSARIESHIYPCIPYDIRKPFSSIGEWTLMLSICLCYSLKQLEYNSRSIVK
jgi:hypothetical protein